MTRMRFGARVALAAVLLLSIAQLPAAAGTAEDPEISKPCGGDATYVETHTPWADICSAWFEDVFENGSGPKSLTGLRMTVAMAGAVGDRPPLYLFEASWHQEGCLQGWFVNDQDGTQAARVAFWERCEGESESRRTDLDRSAVTADGNLLSITLPVAAINSVAQQPLRSGSRLTDSVVSVFHSVQTSAGPGGTLEHTSAGPGREYVIGRGHDSGDQLDSTG